MSKLKINNLSCQRGYNLLFENLSFELNSGEVLKISGPNGSGKTSLMKILSLLISLINVREGNICPSIVKMKSFLMMLNNLKTNNGSSSTRNKKQPKTTKASSNVKGVLKELMK